MSEQMMITEVVESEPMKGTLGRAKWVSLTPTDDGVVVALPKGVEMLTNQTMQGGTLVLLWVQAPASSTKQDVNAR
jgi:hypothetical protein